MKIKTVLVVGAGVAAGMVIANYLTNGAVMDAASDVVVTVKDKLFNKGAEAVEVASEAIEEVGDTIRDTAESL